MLKQLTYWSTALAALASAGCGDSATSSYNATVQGTVTIDGDLAPGGTVTFTPVKKGPVAVGAIAPNGSYSLRIGQGTSSDPDHNKIPSGQYVATVEITGPPGETAPDNEGGPKPAGPRLMADKYASQETSDLTEEVTEGLNVVDLKLDGVWANPPKEELEEADDEATKEESESADSEPANQSESADSVPADASSATSESPEEGDAPTTPAPDDIAPSGAEAEKEEQR